MNSYKKIFLSIAILSFSAFNGFAQKEGIIWYFGVHAGLEFNTGKPVPLLDGALSTVEGCSSISSPSGRLLLYTDGITVYNHDHLIVQDGGGLMGSPDATQSGVIVPVPGDTTMYYVFTVSSLGVGQVQNGFRYTLVNTEANNGLGGVVQDNKNVLLSASTTERVTSVDHANQYGVWVVMHEWESSRFRSYLVTSAGVSADPVISDVGVFLGRHDEHNRDGIGYMKISPDGRKLAVAIMGKNIVQLFDFNDTTGIVSNEMTLPVDTVPYGVEFSADAEFLYASERIADKIYQWDMQAGLEAEINASRKVVGMLSNPFGGALQMAADGKIYIARKSKFYLSRINFPYLSGDSCGFQEVGVVLDGRQCKEGLPTFNQSYFNNFWIIPENQCIDKAIKFYVNSVINIDSIRWNFGDPVSGPDNEMMADTAFHYFTAPGTYTVTATLNHLVTQTTVTKEVKILPLPEVELGDDQTICRGDTAQFSVVPGYDSYCWNDDPGNNLPEFKTPEAGQVMIRVGNVCGNAYDTANVTVQELPVVDLGNDTVIKFNTVIILDAGSQYGIQWSDGSDFSEIPVDYPGTYGVVVWDELGCKSSDTININAVPFRINVPTAFSPNNDNVNDYFKVIPTYEVNIDFEMAIFNRWGEKVFESHNIQEPWDGAYRDTPCPVGVYTWYIDARTFEQNAFFEGDTKMKGNLTLLR